MYSLLYFISVLVQKIQWFISMFSYFNPPFFIRVSTLWTAKAFFYLSKVLKIKIMATSDLNYDGRIKQILYLSIICLHFYFSPAVSCICIYNIVALHACVLQITILIYLHIDRCAQDVSYIMVLKYFLLQACTSIIVRLVKILNFILLYKKPTKYTIYLIKPKA